MGSIGVRELRQQASKLIERVRAGESIEITSHGHLAAMLVPAQQHLNERERLIAAGILLPGSGNTLDVRPGIPAPNTPDSQIVIDDLRAERL